MGKSNYLPNQVTGGHLPQIPPETDRFGVPVWTVWMAAAMRDMPRRWAHVRRVWEKAAALCTSPNSQVTVEDRTMFELAALLHDVGRAIDFADTVPHAFVGARFLDAAGLNRVARFVAYHSGALAEARWRGLEGLCIWKRNEGPFGDLLTYPDMTTGPSGEDMSPNERRDDIANRYGDLSYQTFAFDQITDEIQRGAELAAKWS